MAEGKKKLIIVESPAKARTISKFLGRGYKIEASQGHVRDLPKSQIGVDIEQDFEPKYITIRGRGDIMSRLRKEAKSASQILLATDPDREGEAISWHLGQVLGVEMDKPCRIEFHEITKAAVKEALKHPRPVNMALVDAQQARRVLDRLVGYKISPLLWAKVKKGLSAGRVQSVATRMVVDREDEIDAFIPEEFWEVAVQASAKHGAKQVKCNLKLSTLDGEKAELSNGAAAAQAEKRIREAKFAVKTIKKGERRKMPAPPFTTSTLQQEASRKLGFTTSKTMQVVQQLYEGVDLAGEGTQGLVTYIRTDSVRISAQAMDSLRGYIQERFGDQYLPGEPVTYKSRKNIQDAHEAIRPTMIARTPESIKESLTKEQFNLYRLIYHRFLASQMMPALYETLTMEIAGDGVGLRFYGERKKFAGFTSIYEEGADDAEAGAETVLPQMKEGDTITVEDVVKSQKFTQAPPRYTEASLVRALEEKGIGRPSTYAPTISTIIARGYVAREKKRLYPTELGKMVNAMMTKYFEHIIDSDFTASMEDQLDAVEEGGKEWKAIIRDFYPPFEQELQVAEQQIEKMSVADEVSDVPCDQCGAMMVYKVSRYGRFLACPNFPDCRNIKPIVHYLDATCPSCGGRLQEKTSRKGRKFYGCENYPTCDFVSWEKVVTDKCPVCGSYMVEKLGKGGKQWNLCANAECRHRVEVQNEGQEEEA